jgi:hypothetical protein
MAAGVVPVIAELVTVVASVDGSRLLTDRARPRVDIELALEPRSNLIERT